MSLFALFTLLGTSEGQRVADVQTNNCLVVCEAFTHWKEAKGCLREVWVPSVSNKTQCRGINHPEWQRAGSHTAICYGKSPGKWEASGWAGFIQLWDVILLHKQALKLLGVVMSCSPGRLESFFCGGSWVQLWGGLSVLFMSWWKLLIYASLSLLASACYRTAQYLCSPSNSLNSFKSLLESNFPCLPLDREL